MPTKVAPNLYKADAGEQARVRGEEVTVLPACEDNRGQWYCVTHEEAFQNNLGKDIHIGAGEHTLAWICFVHGLEDPVKS